MRAPFVAPIENLLHLQVDLLCKSTLLETHSELGGAGVQGYESWHCGGCFSSKVPAGSTLLPLPQPLLLPFSNLHFHFNARWQFPFGASFQSILLIQKPKWTAAANQVTFRFDLKCSNYQHYKRWTALALDSTASSLDSSSSVGGLKSFGCC